jgi:hypothetical protein
VKIKGVIALSFGQSANHHGPERAYSDQITAIAKSLTLKAGDLFVSLG